MCRTRRFSLWSSREDVNSPRLRKDKTLTYILDTLKSLETKIDHLSQEHGAHDSQSPIPKQGSQSSDLRKQTLQLISQASESMDTVMSGTRADSSTDRGKHSSSASSVFTPASIARPMLPLPYFNPIEPRQVMTWPAVASILQDYIAEVPGWDASSNGGEKWLFKVSKAAEAPLPANGPTTLAFVPDDATPSWDSNTVVLTPTLVENLSQAYFRTFHCIFPLLDPNHFYDVALPQAIGTSFDENDPSSTLVLLVLALGTVAQEGSFGDPIVDEATGRRSGIRGGSAQRPPGLIYLNEALRRVGTMLPAYDLTVLQSFILFS
jgi:hypothetical protein